MKHTNPCGVGLGATPLEAWERAYATDREAPFGGVIAVNQMLDIALARAIDEIFSEIVIAPAFAEDALELLCRKKNRRSMRATRPITHATVLPLLQCRVACWCSSRIARRSIRKSGGWRFSARRARKNGRRCTSVGAWSSMLNRTRLCMPPPTARWVSVRVR